MIGYKKLLSIGKNEAVDKPIEINIDTRRLPDDEVIDVIVESEDEKPVSKYRVYNFCYDTYMYNACNGYTCLIKGRGLISLKILDNHVDIYKDSVLMNSQEENNDLLTLNKMSLINVFVSSNMDKMLVL
jgi:hypothetical protein